MADPAGARKNVQKRALGKITKGKGRGTTMKKFGATGNPVAMKTALLAKAKREGRAVFEDGSFGPPGSAPGAKPKFVFGRRVR